MRKGYRSSRIGWCFASVLLCLVLAAATGCGDEPPPSQGSTDGSGGNDIPLQTLAQGVNSEYGRIDEIPIPQDAPPECLAISDEEEFQRLVSQAFFQETIPGVDFDRYIVIAAMQGPKPTAGYAITVARAAQDGGDVAVVIEVTEPDPGAITAQVLTSPYHLVLAERASFDPRGELVFVFRDGDGTLISQGFTEV
ncbi:MAG: protease complex subunit PrcB family protein [Actinomycetota bacterium]